MDLLRDTDRVEIEYEYNGVITTFYPDVEPKARHAKPRPEPRRKLGGQIVNLDGTPTGKFWNGRQGNFNSHYKVKKSELPGAIDESPRPPRFRFYQEVNEGLGSCLVKEYASPVPAWEAAGGVVTPVAEGAGVTSWRMPAPKIVYGRHLHRLVDKWRNYINRNRDNPENARLVERYREDWNYHRARAIRKPGKVRQGDAGSIGGWPLGWDFEDRYLDWLGKADRGTCFLGDVHLYQKKKRGAVVWKDSSAPVAEDGQGAAGGGQRVDVHRLVGAATNFLDRAFGYELYEDEAKLETFGHHQFGRLWNLVQAELRTEAKRVRSKGPH